MTKEIIPTTSVVYHESLSDPDIPYCVRVDKEKVGEFLEKLDIPRPEIGNLKILVRKSNSGESASFEYRSGKLIINIYGDDAWEYYEDAMEQAMRLAYGLKVEDTGFADLLYTDKLEDYLRVAPADRGLGFASRLLLNAANRSLNSDFLHEIRHFDDKVSGRFKFWFMFGRIVDALPFVDRIDPTEKSADDFESRFNNHPVWRDLLAIEPKKKTR